MKEDKSESEYFSAFKVTLVFVGALVGAGFASGREAWQYYSVFGKSGFFGIILSCILYMGIGTMTAYLARSKNSSDIAVVMNPTGKAAVNGIVKTVMCTFLFLAYVSLTAAGGALLEAQLGLRHEIGSIIYFMLCVLTCLGGFRSVSARLSAVTPILVAAALVLGIYLVLRNPASLADMQPHEASKVASHWLPAAIGLVAYNGTAAVPVLSEGSVRTKDVKTAVKGAAIGGIILGLCSLILYLGTSTDPEVSANASFPMMELCALVSPALGKLYALFLLLAIFIAEISCFFGATTGVGNIKHRTAVIWIMGIVGYLCSLYGFVNFVANVYSVAGYCSLVFFAMEVINLRLEFKSRKDKNV